MNRKLFEYIAASPSPYHAVEHSAELLCQAGFLPLSEGEDWRLAPGQGYYVTRNGSSLIAFRARRAFTGFMMTAAHSDSPTFKLKENPELTGSGCRRLAVERYGGMIMSSWMDRPLGIAGRVLLRKSRGVETRLLDLGGHCAVIPNVAIHMNRKVNDGYTWNPAVDLLPLWGSGEEKGFFRPTVAMALACREEDILATDLALYNPQEGVEWNGLLSAPRLDDLQCAFAALTAFLSAEESEALPVYCLFDNEEVGSQTKQGAASTFLKDTLVRLCEALGQGSEYRRKVASSFLVSCDNAHAVHPNHPELSDPNHGVKLNGGVVIKYNAAQHYTSDGVSAALFQLICEEAGAPYQRFANRADMAGGSTLGNIANTQVSLNTVDIGLAQLAMHSAWETAGAEDTAAMVRALTAFYGRALTLTGPGEYALV
mgnify:CR=1 FL=1